MNNIRRTKVGDETGGAFRKTRNRKKIQRDILLVLLWLESAAILAHVIFVLFKTGDYPEDVNLLLALALGALSVVMTMLIRKRKGG
jgi:hypothetical protein